MLAAAVGTRQEGKALAGRSTSLAILARLRAPGDLGRAVRPVALIWLIPDTRIERVIAEGRGAERQRG